MNTSVNEVVGAWGPAHIPTREELDVLAKTIWLGMKFDALAVQVQPVNGTNYCFYCIGTPVTLNSVPDFVRVILNVPTSGTPSIKRVERVAACHDPNPVPGGWSGVHKLDADDKKEFDVAIRSVIGVKYDPLAVQSQVVAGFNRCYFCIGTLVGSEDSGAMYAVDTHAAPNRSAVVTHITLINPW